MITCAFVLMMLVVGSHAAPLVPKPAPQNNNNNNNNNEPLGSYVIDANHVYVAGLSSGAYMASQLHIAYSSLFAGHASLAGGPYYCAEDNIGTALGPCMVTPQQINVEKLIGIAEGFAAAGTIDPLEELAGDRAFIFHGLNDNTVHIGTSEKHHQFMQRYTNNTLEIFSLPAGHAYVTDYYGNACSSTSAPWINDCGEDVSEEMLEFFFGEQRPLQPRGTMKETNLHRFNQGEFPAPSTDTTGFVYVPDACAAGQPCALVVSLHGCQQYHSNGRVGMQYVMYTGMNEWAESNNIVVLYPQTVSAITPYNPNGCWDWWGYAGSDFAEKSGPQMKAVVDMVARVMSGAPPLPTPAAPVATAVTDDAVSLQWQPVAGADVYDVRRDGAVVAEGVAGSTHTDANLLSGTRYTYAIVARSSADGGASAPSDELAVTTTGPPPPLAPPADLAVTGTTTSSVSLSWSPVSGAVIYYIHRDGFLTANATSTSYTSTGLQAETEYVFAVAGVDTEMQQGPLSDAVTAVTRDEWACVDWFDNNYQHERDGRAYQVSGQVYAVGSDDYMGLWNVGAHTNLAETAQGYYEVGQC